MPFAVIGGIVALFVGGMYLSVPAAVGFIAVFGVAVLNGVVLVTYINQLRERGRDPHEAAFEAVKRARTHLHITDSGHDRRPASIGSRGRSSLVLNTQIHVVVDGTSVVNGVAALRSIQSGSIESIRILTAREATTVYGTAGGNGVIAVSTSSLVARR